MLLTFNLLRQTNILLWTKVTSDKMKTTRIDNHSTKSMYKRRKVNRKRTHVYMSSCFWINTTVMSVEVYLDRKVKPVPQIVTNMSRSYFGIFGRRNWSKKIILEMNPILKSQFCGLKISIRHGDMSVAVCDSVVRREDLFWRMIRTISGQHFSSEFHHSTLHKVKNKSLNCS